MREHGVALVNHARRDQTPTPDHQLRVTCEEMGTYLRMKLETVSRTSLGLAPRRWLAGTQCVRRGGCSERSDSFNN